MKRYMHFIFLLGLFACQEDELVEYGQEKDAMQFLVDEDKEISFKRTFNFATATYTREEDGVEVEYYYGDSLASFTYTDIILELQGFPTPDERPYKLKTVLLEGQDSTKKAEVVFDSYYSLAADKLRDTIRFTVRRPKTRGTYRVGIVVDTENSDGFFEKGVLERSVLELEIKDVYEEPEGWQERKEWLGEFDEEKYAFMVTYSQKPFNKANNHMWNETDAYNLELRQALAEFNASATPEDRKEFTFPETTKPIWWDSELHLLGEFSEEKHTFMKNIVGDVLKPNERLEYYNIIFRKELEKEGRTDIEVPRNEKMSSWWRNSALGDWSVEKQEFVILNLFPMSNYSITDETWDYANVMLRSVAAKQTEPLAFAFPVEEEPYWWAMRAEMLGEFSVAKRDLLVEYVYTENINDKYSPQYSIYQLVQSSYPLGNMMDDFRWIAEQWNAEHPDETPITFPVIAPAWWANQEIYLGEWSEEKETYIKQVMSSFGATYQEWATWAVWNPILRYELAAYNADSQHTTYEFTFPVSVTKPSYWDELPYLGDYSESKQVFVWMTLMPQNWGTVDGWYLGAPSEWGNMSVWPARASALKTAYVANYEAFMKKYASVNPEPFTFPESY